MEIKQLRVFLAVADAKSFLKAADSLYVSRQAVTKIIDQLEEELQLDLFVRSQKGAMMTPAGIFLYPKASALLAEFDKLKEDTMDIRRSYRTPLRIYMTQGIYSHYAEKLLEYGERYSSDLDLTIRSCLDDDADTLLAGRKADAVLSFARPNANIARTTELTHSPVTFLINRTNPMLRQTVINMSSLLKNPLLLYTNSQGHPLWWYDYPRGKDVCCGDLDYLFTLLRADRGIVPIAKIALPSFLDFAVEVPAPSTVEPVAVHYSTLYPDHYTALAFHMLDDIYTNILLEQGN